MASIRFGRVRRWRCATAVVAGIVLLTAVPAGAAGTWRVEAGDTLVPNTLSAVSCTSRGWCAAVGKAGGQDAISKVFAESGSGSTWKVVPSSGPRDSWLYGVSCVASTWCQAVGWWDNASRPLIERWNGRAWTAVPRLPSSGLLLGVSCTSRSFCMAVGDAAKNKVGALVERWNGKAWSVVPSPGNGQGTALESVSCVSPKWCAAVGSYSAGTPKRYIAHTLVEIWNGKAWRIVPSPSLKGNVTLRSIDCVSSTWCMAGGGYGQTGTPIEHWNGRTWKIMRRPTASYAGGVMYGMSCVSRNACVGVGDGLLAEEWNGTTWRSMTVPNGGESPQFFTGVSCISATRCEAVGDHTAISTTG